MVVLPEPSHPTMAISGGSEGDVIRFPRFLNDRCGEMHLDRTIWSGKGQDWPLTGISYEPVLIIKRLGRRHWCRAKTHSAFYPLEMVQPPLQSLEEPFSKPDHRADGNQSRISSRHY